MPTIEENKHQWSVYDWPEAGEEWSKSWGDVRFLWYATIFPRISPAIPAEHILEIAPGYGRCTQYLLNQCSKMTVVDLAEKCIDQCRKRFADHHNISYHVNDGKSLAFLQDNSIDFAFSWDSLVHANEEVFRSYMGFLSRKLKPGAFGFFHHSNMASYRDPTTGVVAKQSQHWRDLTMSAELFRSISNENGIEVITQEIFEWETGLFSDVFSFFRRIGGAPPGETRIVENPEFLKEVANLRFLSDLYQAKR